MSDTYEEPRRICLLEISDDDDDDDDDDDVEIAPTL